jgi:hypothetical protein
VGSIPGKWILCNSSTEESEQNTQNANSLHVASVRNVDQRRKERLREKRSKVLGKGRHIERISQNNENKARDLITSGGKGETGGSGDKIEILNGSDSQIASIIGFSMALLEIV